MTDNSTPRTVPSPVEAEPPTLTEPADGVPPLTNTLDGFTAFVAALDGSEPLPVGVDTERASSFRYSSRAYLLQFKSPATGIALLDPIALLKDGADFTALNAALAPSEWIIHAASQDLTCLIEIGLTPRRIFDTELAARLVGRSQVGLGPLVESILGVRLLKEHSAADWSQRPLPDDWLTYAALDVEVLADLRDHLAGELEDLGRTEWARQEFDHTIEVALNPPPPRPDPWRRTSDIHLVRTARGMAVVQQMWQTRDRIAAEEDLSPTKLLLDRAITALATTADKGGQAATLKELERSHWFRKRRSRPHMDAWADAVRAAFAAPNDQLPPLKRPSDAIPKPQLWSRRDPAADARWKKIRPAIVALAEELELPVENLISPVVLRTLLWEPVGSDRAAVEAQLAELGARPWQRELIADIIADGLAELAADKA
ncbi:MAG: ribonuclease D [Propionibacteriaceae bacterium]|jgi:ribonuclease D|nr:ribonuclease D [Propionibacteriaceae bacterium]